MNQEIMLYIIAVILAGMLSTFLGSYTLIKAKEAPGARYYILVTYLSAVFTFSYVFEITSVTLEQMKFWLRLEYLALPFIPLCILFMCFEYVGLKIKKGIFYSLFAAPILTIFVHSTNDLHHFYYKTMEVRSDTTFPILKLDGGPWFYVHSIFTFLCIMFSVIILLKQMKKSLFRFRMQILTMTAGLLVPIIATYFYMNGLSPYGIDLGPVSMSLSFLFHGAAIVSYQMFNVAPIAMDTIFTSMREGVIVLNQAGMIVDYNPAVMKVIPGLKSRVIGKSLMVMLEGNSPLAKILSEGKEKDYQIHQDGEIIHYQIRFSPVLNKNSQEIGKIITFVDISDRVRLQEKLQQLARMDGLTDVYNRSYFMRRTEKVINSLKINGGNVAVIMFDIDHFKQINDTYGHDTGDRVLTNIASIAKESLRDTDVIGRYGGEEFVICLPYTSLVEAYSLANNIRTRIVEYESDINGIKINVSSSFGISFAKILPEKNGQSIQTLMKCADKALYEAKRNGRNCVQIFGQVKVKKVQ
ncbi:histidine kinase N-terminal 7TM domain-containing protein [Neobacillus niacini]|uniref:histidine kinase N-terminal 7TM domain-containing diguanylate cyclase n=1 Tax=Neobacillus niacini TaxID=86668 RepID=UPI003983BEDE